MQVGNDFIQVSIDTETTENSIVLKVEHFDFRLVFKAYKVGKTHYTYNYSKGQESWQSSRIYWKVEGHDNHYYIQVVHVNENLTYYIENDKVCRQKHYVCKRSNRLSIIDIKVQKTYSDFEEKSKKEVVDAGNSRIL